MTLGKKTTEAPRHREEKKEPREDDVRFVKIIHFSLCLCASVVDFIFDYFTAIYGVRAAFERRG